MNKVPNVTGQQDIEKLLSIKMPDRDSAFPVWQQYNEQQYSVLLIPEATEEQKKKAMENLLAANSLLFMKRARKEKLMSCGIEFDDVVQIEMLNFIESITKAANEGVTEFPSSHAFDNYINKRQIWEQYSPCGVKASYSTKKRQVVKETYNMQRVTFVEEVSEGMSAKTYTSKSEAGMYAPKDQDLFGSVWQDELRSTLDDLLAEMSDTEATILIGISKGFTNVKMAEILGVSEATVRRSVPRVLEHARRVATDYGLDCYVHDIYV